MKSIFILIFLLITTICFASLMDRVQEKQSTTIPCIYNQPEGRPQVLPYSSFQNELNCYFQEKVTLDMTSFSRADLTSYSLVLNQQGNILGDVTQKYQNGFYYITIDSYEKGSLNLIYK